MDYAWVVANEPYGLTALRLRGVRHWWASISLAVLASMYVGPLAVVIRQNPKTLTAPVVKVFYSTQTEQPITVTQIDLSSPDAFDAIVAREPRSQWNFPQLETLWAGDAAQR